MSAAITPGIQPKIVSINTISIEPHPLSITDNGGKMIAKITLQRLIVIQIALKTKKYKICFNILKSPYKYGRKQLNKNTNNLSSFVL